MPFLGGILLFSCLLADRQEKGESPSAAVLLLEGMTLREKIGQLFFVRPEALCPGLTPAEVNDTKLHGALALSPAMVETLAEYPVGGIIFFGKNVESAEQVRAFIRSLAQADSLPLFFGIDEEGGRVARLANSGLIDLPRVPAAAVIGEGEPEGAYQAGVTLGTYLADLGFNLDFAPVADVKSNPENTVIGDRSFGSDPQRVARMVAAEVKGLEAAGVISCLKHFPGHGDTAGDTHLGFVALNKSWAELEKTELVPFQAGQKAGAEMVMAAHIALPQATGSLAPASLSREIIQGKLRGDLGFAGVVITDSLSMRAITDNYSAGEAALLALEAGADILLMPENLDQAFSRLVRAVEEGTLSQERLDESVLRILRLKEKRGLLP